MPHPCQSACQPPAALPCARNARRRWVDDCHAAVVCADPAAARRLLGAAAAQREPELGLRGYADAGSGTRRLPPSGDSSGCQHAPGLPACLCGCDPGRTFGPRSCAGRPNSARLSCPANNCRVAGGPALDPSEPRPLTQQLPQPTYARAELQPPRPRPKTTAAVAARLIGGALNLRLR
jgi:hypothetical protein